MRPFIAYWQQPIAMADQPGNVTKKRTFFVVMSALLAAVAAILQSAGGVLPGIGYMISPFAVLPIMAATWFSVSNGISAYVVTIGLLAFLQPAELIIFPFTTGLLGLLLGFSLRQFNCRLPVVILSGTGLFAGISFVLLVLNFPLLGPDVSGGPLFWAFLFSFSLVYSSIWIEVSLFFLRRTFAVFRKA